MNEKLKLKEYTMQEKLEEVLKNNNGKYLSLE